MSRTAPHSQVGALKRATPHQSNPPTKNKNAKSNDMHLHPHPQAMTHTDTHTDAHTDTHTDTHTDAHTDPHTDLHTSCTRRCAQRRTQTSTRRCTHARNAQGTTVRGNMAPFRRGLAPQERRPRRVGPRTGTARLRGGLDAIKGFLVGFWASFGSTEGYFGGRRARGLPGCFGTSERLRDCSWILRSF